METSLWKHFKSAMRVTSQVLKHTLVLRHNNQSSHKFSIDHATYGSEAGIMARTADSGRLGYKWYLNMAKELNTRSVENCVVNTVSNTRLNAVTTWYGRQQQRCEKNTTETRNTLNQSQLATQTLSQRDVHSLTDTNSKALKPGKCKCKQARHSRKQTL
jgi:hypothetical protein